MFDRSIDDGHGARKGMTVVIARSRLPIDSSTGAIPCHVRKLGRLAVLTGLALIVGAGFSAPAQVPRDAPVTGKLLLQPHPGKDWPSYNGDYTGRRYSSLAQITAANAHDVAAQWTFDTHSAGTVEATPLVVDGVMYLTASNDAFALDAATGAQLWHHASAVTQGLIDDASGHISRGAALLGNRLYMETDNAHLVCLDARTGSPLWDVSYAVGNRNYGATSAPLIVKNKVLVGTSGGDDGVRGFVAAFDAETGEEAWRFWTVPAPGEPASGTWPAGDIYLHGGGAAWMPGTYDPQLNLLYWGTGNPSPDFDGEARAGDNLYTDSVLALDPDTGRLKWHFQFTPHDVNDYDAEETPVLVDTTFRGHRRRLLVQANRNGFVYVLDRVTGQFLQATPFAQQLNWATGIDPAGRPIRTDRTPVADGTRMCPSYAGGTNWYSPTWNERTRTLLFLSLDDCSVFKRKPQEFKEGKAFYSTGASHLAADNPRRYLNAFDPVTGRFSWRRPLEGAGHSFAGAMSTASGIVVFGNDEEELEVADAASGQSLVRFPLHQPPHASPMSYGVAGRQYVAIAAGHSVFTFALPGTPTPH